MWKSQAAGLQIKLEGKEMKKAEKLTACKAVAKRI
jgi:hypothetical protein